MARYRIEFSRDWIRGRWGFIDRMFHKLGGKETEPSRLENAWLVEYKGIPHDLGNYISDLLEINPSDLQQFGTIFEITVISESKKPRGKRPRLRQAPKRISAPSVS